MFNENYILVQFSCMLKKILNFYYFKNPIIL